MKHYVNPNDATDIVAYEKAGYIELVSPLNSDGSPIKGHDNINQLPKQENGNFYTYYKEVNGKYEPDLEKDKNFLRKAKQADIDTWENKQFSRLTEGYSEKEVESWDMQVIEAQKVIDAYSDNVLSETEKETVSSFLTEYQKHRIKYSSALELAERILYLSEINKKFSGEIRAKADSMEDEIKSLTYAELKEWNVVSDVILLS